MSRHAVRILLVGTAWTLAGAPHAQEPEIASTRHRIQMTGRPLEYTARAGLLPIRNNEAGDFRVGLKGQRIPQKTRRVLAHAGGLSPATELVEV